MRSLRIGPAVLIVGGLLLWMVAPLSVALLSRAEWVLTVGAAAQIAGNVMLAAGALWGAGRLISRFRQWSLRQLSLQLSLGLLGWVPVFFWFARSLRVSGGVHGEPVPAGDFLLLGLFTGAGALIGGYLLSVLGFAVGRHPGKMVGAILGGVAGSIAAAYVFAFAYILAST